MKKDHMRGIAPVRFKRLPVGCRFAEQDGSRFRKAGKRGAHRLNAEGRGQTHAVVPVAANHHVYPLDHVPAINGGDSS